jgi:L-serine deaminase
MSFINLLNNNSPTLAMLEKAAQFAENAAYGTVDMAVANGVTGDAATAVMQQEATDFNLDPQEVTQYAESL